MPTVAEQLIAQGFAQGFAKGFKIGFENGRKEALRNGGVMGRIRFVQTLLGRPVISLEELLELDPVALAKLDADLQSELARR